MDSISALVGFGASFIFGDLITFPWTSITSSTLESS